MDPTIILILLCSCIYCVFLMNENSQLKKENSDMRRTIEDMKNFYKKFWEG
jgi:hypothetical protein